VKRSTQKLSLAFVAAVLPCAFHLGFAPAQASSATAESAEPILEAKFDRNVDTKSAKLGDPVFAKTLKAIKLADGTEIPKGSKLVAKIISVQSKKEGNGNSMLTFRFDEADVKGGAAVPIHGEVVAIGPSLAPKDGLGPYSVMSRSQGPSNDTSNAGRGVGSSNGIDPNTGVGKGGAKDEDDIPMGSTLEGVALGIHKDADWTTALQGVKCDIKLSSDVNIKVQLK
jgi:hypothetical protein